MVNWLVVCDVETADIEVMRRNEFVLMEYVFLCPLDFPLDPSLKRLLAKFVEHVSQVLTMPVTYLSIRQGINSKKERDMYVLVEKV